MLTIALCDDDFLAMNQEEKIIQEVLEELGINEYRVCRYDSAEGLLEAQVIGDCDIFFLDYEMPNMNGVELAGKIRSQCPNAFIAMSTGYIHCVNDSFRVEANRFLMKPYVKDEFAEALKSTIERKSRNYLYVSDNRREIQIDQKLICELVSSYAMTEIYTEEGQFHISDSLSNVEQLLTEEFFCRISRNQIVNMNYVQKKNSEYYLRDIKLKISRRRERDVFEKYTFVKVLGG